MIRPAGNQDISQSEDAALVSQVDNASMAVLSVQVASTKYYPKAIVILHHTG
jgi:hypothetical protein